MTSIKLILSFLLLSRIVLGCNYSTTIPSSDKPIDKLNQENINLLDTNKKLNLIIQRDSLNRKTIFYLEGNNEIIDSSIIDRVNFKFDSLSILEETKWHYIYSFQNRGVSGLDVYNQIIIEILDKKIHFSYVGTYRYSSLQDKNQSYGYFFDKKYQLNLKDPILGSHLKLTKITWDIDKNGVQIDSSEHIIFLDYDSEKNIYHNKIDTLNGFYSYHFLNGFIKEVHINNEIVMATENIFYYKGKWFSLSGLKSYEHPQGIYPFQNIDENWLSTKK